ncbi:MAG: alanine--tRNA ligase [Candidatus Aenigmatarchaeota archaeon]|nr:alanine--tRNA ligase [Candidatus Aenigmarchaeota archaeon]
MITARELKRKYIEFFKSKGHIEIKSAPLIPENDPTVLFTTAGMHPLVPYLLGEPHPAGKRLVNVQKCLRTDDIDDVGDAFHNTFFEMLGNWSLGDYFKKEAIEFAFEFLAKFLKIDVNRLSVTVFEGDSDAPRDNEAIRIWKSLGIPERRIFLNPKKDNWWGPVGERGPCGPDTEIFFDTGKEKCSKDCKPGCKCGKYFEIWNLVFMEYNKTENGYELLKQKNVDTGMGVERTTAILQGKDNVYDTELFLPIIEKIRKNSKIKDIKHERIIADHIRASVFALSEGLLPSNVERGYVLRRLIRRAIRSCYVIKCDVSLLSELARVVISIYHEDYPELISKKSFIIDTLRDETKRFEKTLERGLNFFEKIVEKENYINGKNAFLLYQSFGFPLELTKEIARERRIEIDEEGFKEEYKKHQELSRTAAKGMFKGGLLDASEISKKYHTATHLLHQALREVLGDHVRQVGSNITSERLRFDFTHDKKLTKEEIEKVEKIVNEKIKEGLEVKRVDMPLEEAKKIKALGFFEEKYGKIVSVYMIGDYSKEICGGPHVDNTSKLGKFKIIKEEGVGAGIRRIKAILIQNEEYSK